MEDAAETLGRDCGSVGDRPQRCVNRRDAEILTVQPLANESAAPNDDSIDAADAWHRLAVQAVQAGEFDAAKQRFRRAVELNPRQAVYLNNFALLCRARGELAEAIELLRRAIAIKPHWAPAQFGLGAALEQTGELAAAAEHYRWAAEIKPHAVETHAGLARVLAMLGRWAEARVAAEQAAQLEPANFALQNNLGAILQELGELDAAAECYRRSIREGERARRDLQWGRSADAATSADAQGALQFIEAHLNLAALHTKRREFDAAVARLEIAQQIAPDSAEVCNRLANALLPLGRWEAAKTQFAAAARIEPQTSLWQLRCDLTGPLVFESREQIDAYQCELAARLADHVNRPLQFDVEELASCGCQPPVELMYQGRDDLTIRRQLAAQFESALAKKGDILHFAGKVECPHFARPRGGFFVPKGSEGIFLRGMAGVLNRLSPKRFETMVVCAAQAVPKLRESLVDSIGYVPLPGGMRATIETVRAARLDLLYYWEVGVDSLSYFLPMFRVARRQCSSWGWPTTSGIAAMDYFLSSDLLEPPGAERHYSERLLRLRNVPNYYTRPEGEAPRPDRQRFGISPSRHIYVCAQNPRKIQPDFDALAGAILRRDPRGELLLIEARWPAVTAAIRKRFVHQFPECAPRLRILPRMTHGDYLTLLATADVVLDTPGYCGGANSTYDALAAGAPVVTLPGELHRGRYTLAAYRQLDVADCIAASPEDYVAKAVQLATDPLYRQKVRSHITDKLPMLFDNVVAVRDIEAAFEEMLATAQ